MERETWKGGTINEKESGWGLGGRGFGRGWGCLGWACNLSDSQVIGGIENLRDLRKLLKFSESPSLNAFSKIVLIGPRRTFLEFYGIESKPIRYWHSF